MSNSTAINYTIWSLQKATTDDIIFIFVCAPVSIFGCFLCLISAYFFSSEEFKEKLFRYLKIECILMAIDLSITSFRSLAPLYMCRTTTKTCPPQLSLFPVIIDTYIFAYVPSPVEACALAVDIFAALNCLFMVNQHQSWFQQFIVNLNPYIMLLTTATFFATMFFYQVFTNKYLFYIDFIIVNRKYFDIVTYSIRDGLLLAVLIVLNFMISLNVKKSLARKMTIQKEKVKDRVKRSQNKLTIMVLADCINSIIGRIPIFALFIIKNVYKPLTVIVPLSSLCSLAVFLSYFLKFFLYFNFNKRFRQIVCQKIPFLTNYVSKKSLETTQASTTTNLDRK